MKGHHSIFRTAVLAYVIFLFLGQPFTLFATAWSNSGPSDDPANPNYGTHDWIAHHALDYLPDAEKSWLEGNMSEYLYGTELPDFQKSITYPDGIGDQMEHHIYFEENGDIMAVTNGDSAALRAQEEFDLAVQYLKDGNNQMAARHAGIMAHYMGDVAVFGHAMGYYTDWMNRYKEHYNAWDDGSESYYNHRSYEQYVNRNTTSYESDEWGHYLSYDGSFSNQTAYQLTVEISYNVTFNPGYYMTCYWVDDWLTETNPYNETTGEWTVDEATRWGNASFHRRTGELLDLAVNNVADALHNIYVQSEIKEVEQQEEPESLHPIWGFIAFGIVLSVVFFVYFKYILK
jgi:hypothetical protein